MIQGGGFTRDMIRRRRGPIKNEADNGCGTTRYARHGAHHDRRQRHHQFFINLVDNTAHLDFKSKTDSGYGYCVFGKVVDGMDVVDKIAKVRTGFPGRHQNVPVEPVVLNSIRRKPTLPPATDRRPAHCGTPCPPIGGHVDESFCGVLASSLRAWYS
jgi:peptidyl-prolyl cis-trans isomerase B (cyclophilin B)